MGIVIAIILGLVQGLTEFIPVSSSGHLEIVQQLIGNRSEDFHYFLELINFGTLLALIIFYRKRIAKILRDVFVKHNFKLAVNVIITCIPAGLAGLLLSSVIEENAFFSSLWTIAVAMLVVGILMVKVEKLPHASELKSENHLTPKRALGIGVAQIFALIPGVSRSGSTILAGRVSGMDSESSANYSFLCSIPLMLAVCGKTLLSSSTRDYLFANFDTLLLANVVAFISGMIAIKYLLKFLRKEGSLETFGYYRITLALIVLVFMLIK